MMAQLSEALQAADTLYSSGSITSQFAKLHSSGSCDFYGPPVGGADALDSFVSGPKLGTTMQQFPGSLDVRSWTCCSGVCVKSLLCHSPSCI
jgi:hypothetical protein